MKILCNESLVAKANNGIYELSQTTSPFVYSSNIDLFKEYVCVFVKRAERYFEAKSMCVVCMRICAYTLTLYKRRTHNLPLQEINIFIPRRKEKDEDAWYYAYT